MNSRTFIYSLKNDLNGQPILSIDLMHTILFENNHLLELTLPEGRTALNKYEYVNTFKVYDNGKVFFFVCNKQVDRDFVFDKLLDYDCTKIDTRIVYLEGLKQFYKAKKKLKVAA